MYKFNSFSSLDQSGLVTKRNKFLLSSLASQRTSLSTETDRIDASSTISNIFLFKGDEQR
jgi:hypothetical protein